VLTADGTTQRLEYDELVFALRSTRSHGRPDTYPFVRLHSPSNYYGAMTCLGAASYRQPYDGWTEGNAAVVSSARAPLIGDPDEAEAGAHTSSAHQMPLPGPGGPSVAPLEGHPQAAAGVLQVSS